MSTIRLYRWTNAAAHSLTCIAARVERRSGSGVPFAGPSAARRRSHSWNEWGLRIIPPHPFEAHRAAPLLSRQQLFCVCGDGGGAPAAASSGDLVLRELGPSSNYSRASNRCVHAPSRLRRWSIERWGIGRWCIGGGALGGGVLGGGVFMEQNALRLGFHEAERFAGALQ
eukprot:gene16513-biopygen9323